MFKFVLLVLLALFGSSLFGCANTPQSSPIEYQRTGGIVGFNDHLVIDTNGHAKLTRRNGQSEFNVNADDLSKLYEAFRTAGFATIPENSVNKLLVPDELSYRVTFQNHTVKTSDTAMPAQLQPVIARLNTFLDSGPK